ncbi:amino acid ABC transporter permease [Rhodococcus zopfii]|uniref:Amino acid ABC transporter permease n=1 Tax=Rhodococcus zopfii TaxID=43772 RepID=A0ABU3WWX1_9NOCA|nr:amino acid ABC transporter permease [Rhodococcus zopfii]MDV2478480.1 amino acid ABC transporter permease [Rhodococcus zopfii]
MNPFPADSVVGQYFPVFLEGAVTTLAIVLAAIVCATALGYFIALMRLSRFRLLSAVAAVYVWFFRGLPLMLSLFFFYYTQPFGWTFDAFTAGLIAMSLNSAAFFSEIIRAGIQSVARGHLEAAESIGMNPLQKFFRVTAPEGIRLMTPPYINNCIIMLKESAQVSVITVPDLMLQGQKAYNSTYNVVETLGVVAVMYLAMTSLLMGLQLLIERKTGRKVARNTPTSKPATKELEGIA